MQILYTLTVSTLKILSFRAILSVQKMETKSRLSQGTRMIRIYTVAMPCMHLCRYNCMVEPEQLGKRHSIQGLDILAAGAEWVFVCCDFFFLVFYFIFFCLLYYRFIYPSFLSFSSFLFLIKLKKLSGWYSYYYSIGEGGS